MTDSNKKNGVTEHRGSLLLKGSAMQLAAFTANFLSAFLLMPFLIHHLGDRGYGFWALIGTIVGQLGVLDVGFMSTTQRFMANALARDDYEEATSIYSTSMVIFWAIGGVVSLAVLVIAFSAPYWLTNKTEIWDFEIALLISGFNLAIQFPFAILQAALTAKFRSDAAVIGQFASTLVRTVLAIVVVKMGYGIIALAITNFIASLALRSVLIFMMRRHLPQIDLVRSAVTKKTAKELFAFGKFIFLTNASDAARYRFHNIIIAALSGIAAVTHYSVAIRLADYFLSIISRISIVSSPVYAHHFARGEDDLLRSRFLTLTRLGVIICCVFVSGAIVFGRPFLRLWLGRGFDDSYFALTVLLLGMFFALVQNSSRMVLRAIYKHAFDANTNLIEVIVNLVLAVLLVPRFGILGAAIGTAIPMIIVKGIVLPVYVCRTIKLAIWQYYWAIAKYVVVSVALSALVYACLPFVHFHRLMVLVAVGAGFSLFLSMALFLLLPRADKASVIDAVGRGRIRKIPGGRLLLSAIA